MYVEIWCDLNYSKVIESWIPEFSRRCGRYNRLVPALEKQVHWQNNVLSVVAVLHRLLDFIKQNEVAIETNVYIQFLESVLYFTETLWSCEDLNAFPVSEAPLDIINDLVLIDTLINAKQIIVLMYGIIDLAINHGLRRLDDN